MSKLFVGNLSYDVAREQLMEAFGTIGPVADVVIPLDRATGRMRGFAFVEFENPEDGERAIEALNGKELAGRPMRVNEAQARPPRAFIPRGEGGDDFSHGFGNRPFKSKGSRRGIRRRKRGF